jgi:serine/threonine-protein kinase
MIGKCISHYRITRELGAGGMGIVYEAVDLRLDRTVAIKLLPADRVGDREAKARFIHEAKAASSLDHPNVCTIFQIDETDDGQLFLAMAHYEGETLKERIARGPASVDEAIDIVRQTAEGLGRAHEQCITHRDIKPANIFVTVDGLVKILDFGLAKLEGQTQITRTGATLGTISYMAPEQARGEAADGRSDLWALGVVLYELVAGTAPFRGETATVVLHGIQYAEPAPLTGLRTGIPLELERIISKCLTKEPRERYQHADDMIADLLRLQRARFGTTAQPTGLTPRKQTTLRRATFFASITLLAGLAAVAIWYPRSPMEPGPMISAIAVLPFENLMNDESRDFLVDGMHEALITDLSRRSGLKVISRTSVMRYRETMEPVRAIAAQLGVDGLIEGSVLLVGDRVRVTVHLVDADSDRQIWARGYERDMAEILALQRDVASAIVGEVSAVLAQDTAKNQLLTSTIDASAVEAYMLGRHLWNRRTAADIQKAIDYFEQAITIAPNYAMAHSGLADAYAILAINNLRAPETCYPLARDAAWRALELDSELAEAHVSLAYVHLYGDRDWFAAECDYRRAIELNPNCAVAHQWYAMLLETRGQFAEASARMESARQLDPLSALVLANVARRQAMARRYDEALITAQQALEMDPDLLFTQEVVAEIHLWRRDYRAHAQQLVEILEERMPTSAYGRELLLAYEDGGEDDYWAKRVELDRRGVPEIIRRHTREVYVAALAETGRFDEAFAEIEGALDQKLSYVAWLKVYPLFDVLRPDPRYARLLDRLGLDRDTASMAPTAVDGSSPSSRP